MHDIRWIRENAGAFDAGLEAAALRRSRPSLLAIDDRRARRRSGALQAAQERRNAASKEIGQAMAAKDARPGRGAEGRGRGAEGAHAGGWRPRRRRPSPTLDDALAAIPNVPLADVPVGRDEHDNVEMRQVGEPRTARLTGFAPRSISSSARRSA